jgi:hypothetical protein
MNLFTKYNRYTDQSMVIQELVPEVCYQAAPRIHGTHANKLLHDSTQTAGACMDRRELVVPMVPDRRVVES